MNTLDHDPTRGGGPPEWTATPAQDMLRRAGFLAFFGFMLVVLNCLVDDAAIDVTLVPRLLAALVFLLATVVVTCIPRVARLLDASILAAPIVLFFGGYLLITCGSLLVALNLSAGFTDVFRTLATFVTLCLSALLLPTVPDWKRRLLEIFAVAATVTAAAGAAEIGIRIGPDMFSRRVMEQVTGLMSSVNLYAGMLALLLPWCACGAVVLRGGWRILAGVATAALLVLVLLLQCRAAWLAVLAGAATAGGVLFVRHADFGLSRRARNTLAAAGLGAALALLGAVALAPDDNPLARRFRSIFTAPDDPAAPPREGGRLMIWGITARMIADHPLTGVGAGNFTVRLHEYFGEDDLDFSNVHTNWVQPHNDFLWVFAEKGGAGILVFVGCFAAAGAGIRRVLRSAVDPLDRWLGLATAAGLASYATLSCFDFPLERINHQVALAVLLATVAVLDHALRHPSDRRAAATTAGGGGRSALSYGKPVAVAATLAALGLGIAYSLAAIRQEKEVIVARQAWKKGRWEEMLAAARRATTPWKTLDPVVSPVAFLEGMAQVRLGNVAEGIACLERARRDNPNRLYVINNLGILYAGTGRLEEAIECFSLVAERYPHRIEPFNNLAGCLIEAGYAAEAIQLLEQIPEDLRTEGVLRNLALAREQAAADPAGPDTERPGAE